MAKTKEALVNDFCQLANDLRYARSLIAGAEMKLESMRSEFISAFFPAPEEKGEEVLSITTASTTGENTVDSLLEAIFNEKTPPAKAEYRPPEAPVRKKFLQLGPGWKAIKPQKSESTASTPSRRKMRAVILNGIRFRSVNAVAKFLEQTWQETEALILNKEADWIHYET